MRLSGPQRRTLLRLSRPESIAIKTYNYHRVYSRESPTVRSLMRLELVAVRFMDGMTWSPIRVRQGLNIKLTPAGREMVGQLTKDNA